MNTPPIVKFAPSIILNLLVATFLISSPVLSESAPKEVVGEISADDLGNIVRGKSQAEVLKVLGAPTSQSFGENGHWTYKFPSAKHKFKVIDAVTRAQASDLTIWFNRGKAGWVKAVH